MFAELWISNFSPKPVGTLFISPQHLYSLKWKLKCEGSQEEELTGLTDKSNSLRRNQETDPRRYSETATKVTSQGKYFDSTSNVLRQEGKYSDSTSNILRQEGKYSDSTSGSPKQHTSTDWGYTNNTTETPGRQLWIDQGQQDNLARILEPNSAWVTGAELGNLSQKNTNKVKLCLAS